MEDCIERFTNYCYRRELVSEDQIPWLRYGIEKRVASILGLIPFFILAILLSNLWCSVWFIFGFCFLRGRINGYHSKTFLGCFFVSVATELLFLMAFCPLFIPNVATIVSFICSIILCRFAPFNHPNMNYTTDEILALRKSIRRRVYILCSLILILLGMRFFNALRGLAIGVAMATYMLGLAYILEWRKHK